MPDWKELGEIPDSEDEDGGFDSQDITGAPVLPVIATNEAIEKAHDIYDVPESPTTEAPQSPLIGPSEDVLITNAQTTIALDSSPLSSVGSDRDLPSIDRLFLSGLGDEPGDDSYQHTHISSVRARETSRIPNETRAPTATPLEAQGDTDLDIRQIAVRQERSLRPRKPIQEHPYLLENAHYSSVLRQHGFKPIRFTVGAERRQRQGTPPDDDFVDESQNSGPVLSQESESQTLEDVESQSQRVGFEQSQEDLLAHPSSSPPKTSPLKDVMVISSRPSSPGDTDNTSLLDHELPDINELLTLPPRHKSTSNRRRGASPLTSSTRKRQKFSVELKGRPLSEASPSRAFNFSDVLVSPPRLVLRKPVSSPSPSPNPSPSKFTEKGSSLQPESLDVPEAAAYAIDSDSDSSHTEAQGETLPESRRRAEENTSESESELVTKVGRRIKGVLPASWLRLDQQAGREKIQRDAGRRPQERTGGQESRRGIAQRTSTMNTSANQQLVFNDLDSDSDDEPRPQRGPEDAAQEQVQSVLQPLHNLNTPPGHESDDGSIMEDDRIDYMPSGRKRQLKLLESFQASRKRTKATLRSEKAANHALRQKRIPSMIGGPSRAHSSSQIAPKHARQSRRWSSLPQATTSRKAKKTRQKSPVHLSILDVIDSDAPKFLKIAARTARKRRDQGRSSLGRKSIHLAAREDHVDAASVLHDWKTGSIKPRSSVTMRMRTSTDSIHKNQDTTVREPEPTAPAPGKLGRAVGARKHLSLRDPGRTTLNAIRTKSVPDTNQRPQRAHSGVMRRAQLETDFTIPNNRHAFQSVKRLLDRLYQRKQRISPQVGSQAFSDAETASVDEMSLVKEPESRGNTKSLGKPPKPRRCRKTKPRCVDTQAPEYTQAHDPLPVQYVPVEQPTTNAVESKLLGLGPYGTFYSHHFEVFPLAGGTYFHESTLIGQGIIETLKSNDYSPKISATRPRVSFSLDDQTLKWDCWTEQVSSELGIAIDFVADQVEKHITLPDVTDDQRAISVVASILRYITNSVSFVDQAQTTLFISRMVEVLQSFNHRLSACTGAVEPGRSYTVVLKIYDRLLLTITAALRMCEDSTLLTNNKFEVQDLLKDFAKTAISVLLANDVDDIRQAYDDMKNDRMRERGLREDQATVHAWVILIKVLEIGKIPRASFWDLLQGVLASPTHLATSQVVDLERIWKTLFCLLPLMEFNDSGVVVGGRRHYIMTDGWTIPQKLLKKVFQFYQDDPRQAPSFNNYCRALVARCHYLVDQWGWRKPVAIVGLIFDFFGSQGLGNLRNEEAFRSARFLEELGRQPNLSVLPEDRCFHVFLKLLALSLRKLRESNSVNDIRNLVARTLPNHNRQYKKEQNIHERDLAALRNHHDLLCTLFWGAPPDLRPGIGLIESLVDPTASHKEAALINLRAWRQLARFIVATGEATTSFEPFALWRDAFFQQSLHLFDCVKSDIQRQYLSLPRDVIQTVDKGMVDAMIATNQKAILDILHFSVTASLEIMKQAPDLAAAISVVNTTQLQHVFRHFAVVPPELDWGILRQCLASVDGFLSRVDQYADMDSQASEASFMEQTKADEALFLLDSEIAKSFFGMARSLLSSRAQTNAGLMATSYKEDCTEVTVQLAAKMGAKLVRSGFLSPSQLFKPGKYGLFDEGISKLSLDARKYVTLFATYFLKSGFDDLGDIGFSLVELWAVSIVKPRSSLRYEYQLAEQLMRLGKDFVPDAIIGLSIQPDYRNNKDLFEYLISAMRKSLNSAGPSLHKTLTVDYAKVLKLVMDQLKEDLRYMARQELGHYDYVLFAREIIAIIRAQGSDICNVDDYFYQTSNEYSPPPEDPQFQGPKMIAYGLRIGEEDARATHQFFFFLLNNFKTSMMSDSLGEQAEMLRKGMKNEHVLRFILGLMVPSIACASLKEKSAFVLLDVYVEALRLLLQEYIVPKELSKDEVSYIQTIAVVALNALRELGQGIEPLDAERVHVFSQMIAMFNMCWPSIYTLGLSYVEGPARTQATQCVRQMEAVVQQIVHMHQPRWRGVDTLPLEGEVDAAPAYSHERPNQNIRSFAEEIIRDSRNNWTMAQGRLTVQVPGKARGITSTQPNEGVKLPDMRLGDLEVVLKERVLEFRGWLSRLDGTQTRGTKHNESILF